LFVSDSLAHLLVTSRSDVFQIGWINQNSGEMLLLFLNSWYNSLLMKSVEMSALIYPHLEKGLLFKMGLENDVSVFITLAFLYNMKFQNSALSFKKTEEFLQNSICDELHGR